MCNPEENIFYVYVYLDPSKPGHYVYGEYEFDYEPFYVGKGCNGRAYVHLCEWGQKHNNNKFFINKINKIRRITGNDPIIIKYREDMLEDVAFGLEVDMSNTIGRKKKGLGPLCNLTDCGKGASGYKQTEEHKRKIGMTQKGKLVSEETKKKISKAKKGHIHTEEVKNKMSVARKGKKHTEETKRKIGEANKNPSEETRKKMSEANKGKIVSEETKRKIGEANKNPSEETRRKIGMAHKGKLVSEETRKKMSEANKKSK